jgi:hypothetical protein
MKIQMESTEIMAEVDGIKTRIWNGITEDGVQCFVFAAYVAFRADMPISRGAEQELIELDPPEQDGRLKGRV